MDMQRAAPRDLLIVTAAVNPRCVMAAPFRARWSRRIGIGGLAHGASRVISRRGDPRALLTIGVPPCGFSLPMRVRLHALRGCELIDINIPVIPSVSEGPGWAGSRSTSLVPPIPQVPR